MAKKFRLYNTNEVYRTKVLEKASATVIEAWDLVALDAGWLAIKAVAASTAIAYTETGAGDGETEIVVIADKDVVLSGTADANFAKANRGTEVDITDTTQLIDLGASATDVLKILPSEDAGTVGATTEVKVKINKSIF